MRASNAVQFIYLLNAMEHASQADHPDMMGYAEKRRAVLEYVAKLEALRPEELQGAWAKDDPRRAFVEGAKWWEYHKTGATMWPEDVNRAEQEAEKRYGTRTPMNNGEVKKDA